MKIGVFNDHVLKENFVEVFFFIVPIIKINIDGLKKNIEHLVYSDFGSNFRVNSRMEDSYRMEISF